MTGKELRKALRGAKQTHRVRVTDGFRVHLIECHSRGHARKVAASAVHAGKRADVELVLHLH